MARHTLGVIIGNRDFFPDVARLGGAQATCWRSCESLGRRVRAARRAADRSSAPSRRGQHAKACADLFRRHRDAIDGVLVCLPNFGDEKGVADALKLSGAERPRPGAGLPRRPRAAARRAAPRRVLRQGLGLQQPEPVRHPLQPDRAAHACTSRRRSSGEELLTVPRRLPRGEGAARREDRRDRRAAERVQHHALQREAAAGGRHQRQHARPVRGARGRAATRATTIPRVTAEARRDHGLRRRAGRA